MRISEALKAVSKLYIDTAPIIYFTERVEPFASRVYALFESLYSSQVICVTSTITLTEVLTKPLREQDTEIETAYREMLSTSESFIRMPVTDAVAQRAAHLRAAYNLRTPDALHIATAVETQCEAFLTNDIALMRIKTLRIILIDDLELDEPNPVTN